MPGENTGPMRVGLLVNHMSVPGWAARALAALVADDGVEVTTLVVNDTVESDPAKNMVLDVASKRWWGVVWGVQRATQIFFKPWYWRPHELGDVVDVEAAEVVRCEPISEGSYSNRLPEEVVETLAAETDVVVRFGFGIIKGDVLDAPEHGVLSYHHGDIREYRGQPAALWEFLHGEDEIGVTVQRLNETLDGGQIVSFESIDASDAHTWQEMRERMYEASEPMLADAVGNLRDPSFEPESVDELGELYTTPGLSATVRYVARSAVGRLRRFTG